MAAAKHNDDLIQTIAHHDAAIGQLGGRMTGVESGLRTLQGEVHAGFVTLGSKLDKLDAIPKFDFHQTVKTVSSLVFLFASVVAGIIWIATQQFALTRERVTVMEGEVSQLKERVGWTAKVERK